MADDDAWVADAKKAITISFVTPSGTGFKTLACFHPAFTYHIFGDAETIFGYQCLKVNLRYHASDMRPCLSISSAKKYDGPGEDIDDIEESLRPYLPEVAFQKPNDFAAAIKSLPRDWTPPGTISTSFSVSDGAYEIWKGSLVDLPVKQLVGRLQILLGFFIEGAITIDLEDPDINRWTAFFLYQKQPIPGGSGRYAYVFAGYTTLYRFFMLQAATPPASPHPLYKEAPEIDPNFNLDELPSRTRLSQFLITPPYQHKGLGVKLYAEVHRAYLNHTPTKELTVEDPNEAFDDLRDLVDLQFLRQQPEFQALRINTDVKIAMTGPVPTNIVDKAAAEEVRKKFKIAPRQFIRVLEMELRSRIPDTLVPSFLEEAGTAPAKTSNHEYELWKLLVKKRLYRHNRDGLILLDLPERQEKLEAVLSAVEFGYIRLLDVAKTRTDTSPIGKRKFEDKDGEPSISKKLRV